VVFTANVREANRHARLLASRALSPVERRDVIASIAESEAGLGRHAAADRVLAMSSEIPARRLLGMRAAVALAPFAERSFARAHLDSLRRALTHLQSRDPPANDERPIETVFDRYQLGLLAARLDHPRAASAIATRLASPDDVQRSRSVSLAYARGIQAEITWRRGDRAGALRLLVDSQPPISLELQQTPEGSLVYARWSRAELLRELGQWDEALAWYESLAVTSPHEVMYLAPSHLRRAQILAQRGDSLSAAAHYRRFARLWERSDPGLAQMAQDAATRARALDPRDKPR
jgi:tetratricopeptide (TPR) repeat protein